MQSLNAASADELKQHLAAFGDDCLFRGQVQNYAAQDGSPILNSSFNRHGCVPPLMLKWIFYVEELLRRGGFDISRPDARDITQGLLQHYGWRSFFVDLSSSAAVGAWFASHAFESKRGLNLCENASEEPVLLAVHRARYLDFEGAGNLYVLRKPALQQAGHKIVSLIDDLSTDCWTRFLAQKAWLASLFWPQERLDPAAIVAHVTAPAAVFRELASAEGLRTTGDLFPAPNEDRMLGQLLSLPRIKIPVPDPVFDAYARSLDIPEYHDSYVKHLPPSTVLADSFWPSDVVEVMQAGLCFRVPEDVFYGHVDVGAMPHLVPYLIGNPVTHIETDKLVCLPVVKGSNKYQKGLSIRRNANGLYEIGSLGVDYVSDQIAGLGVDMGYAYRIEESRFVRVPSNEDCGCGDTQKHFYHLRACAVLNDLLGSRPVTRAGNIVRVSL